MGFFGENSGYPFSRLLMVVAALAAIGQVEAENASPVLVDRVIPLPATTAVKSAPAEARPTGSVFDGRAQERPASGLMPAAPETVQPVPEPVVLPKSAFNIEGAGAVTASEVQRDEAKGKAVLQKSPRIERLRRILGSDALVLPRPAGTNSVFSSKFIDKLGVEDAAAASISQSYLLAAAESRQAYSESLAGVARGALLPQVKLSMKRGREKTSPGADTYKYAKDTIYAKDSSGANTTTVLYNKGDRVPTSSLMNGGVDANALGGESFAYDSIDVPRRDRTLTVTQSLFDYAAWAEVSRQNRAAESSEHAARGARLKAVLDSTTSYLRLFQTSLSLRFAEDYERALQSLYDRIEDRVSAGAGSPADQERVKGRRVNARSTVLDAKNALEVELTAFQKLTGFRPAKLSLPPDWILPVPDNIDAAVQAASDNNPALQADLKQAESVLAELRKVKGSFLPQVGIEYSDSLTRGTGGTRVPIVTSSGPNFVNNGTSVDLTDVLTTGETPNYNKRVQSLMLTLNWSLFSGGQDYYQHRATGEKYNEAMFRLLDTRRELEEKLRASFESLATTAARVHEIGKETESNQQVVETFTDQMFVANRSLLDVLDAHQKLYQSRLDYLRLLIAEANLAYEVLYNIGTLNEALHVPASAQSPRGIMGSLVGQDVWRK